MKKILGILGLSLLSFLASPKPSEAEIPKDEIVPNQVEKAVKNFDNDLDGMMGVGSHLNDKGCALTYDLNINLAKKDSSKKQRIENLLPEKKNIVDLSLSAEQGDVLLFKAEASFLRDASDRDYTLIDAFSKNWGVEEKYWAIGGGGLFNLYYGKPSHQIFYGVGPKIALGQNKKLSSKYYIKKQSIETGLYFGPLVEKLNNNNYHSEFAVGVKLLDFSQEFALGKSWELGYNLNADILFGSKNNQRSSSGVRIDTNASVYAVYPIRLFNFSVLFGLKTFYSYAADMPDNLGLTVMLGMRG